MQHLAQEIPKLLIVGNTEDIKRGGCVEGESLWMHPVLVFFSEASAFVCCLRQDIGLDGPFIYPGVAVFCVWGVEWAVMIQDLIISNVTFLSCLNLYGCSASSAFLKSCSQQKCSIGGGKESVPSSRALLCIYVFLCIYFGLDGDFFFLFPSE